MADTAGLEPIKAAVVTSSLDGIVVVDEAGCVLALNPAAEAMFGYALDEAQGRPIGELIVPDHLREAHAGGFAAYVAGGEPKVLGKRVETHALHKEGRLIPVELTVLEIMVEGRRVFTATIRDRSKHAAQDEQFEQTRRQLELAVEGAELGVWSYNPRTGVSWYSDRVKEIVGFDENFLADGEAFRQRVHPDDRSQLVFDRDTDFPEGPVAAEYRIVRPDGETRWLHSLGAAERGAAGEVEAIHGVIIDITDRKRAEEDLERMRQRLELAVEGAELGVWMLNPRDGSWWFSDRARDLLGLADNHLAGLRGFRERVHPEDWERLKAHYGTGFPEGSIGVEYRIVGPGGETRWMYGLGAAERDDKGEVEAVHGVVIDITDRKQAEEELDSTRRQLELAVQGAQLGTWRFDPRDASCWFSDRSRDLLGLEDNFMPDSRELARVVHPDDWEALAAPYYNRYPDEPLAMEFRVVRPDGGIRWISALGAAARDEQGEFIGVIGIHLDVTERKQAEHELQLIRDRLALAVDGARLGIWSFDVATSRTWYSDRSKEMYGLPPDAEMSAAVIQAALHPDDWDEVARPYLTGFDRDRLEVEYRVLRPDGTTRWIYSLGAVVRDAEGVAHTVNGIHLDITGRKQADQELAETRRHLELAVEGAKIGIWSVDPKTGETWYSDRSRDLWGVGKELHLDAKTLKSYIHPDDWPIVISSYRDGFPGDTIAHEIRVVWPNGETRWVQSLGRALRDPNGEVVLVSGIHIDVTERKRAEEELARSREALVQSEKLAALGTMLAGVSHELNNPLAAIVGQAEMLAEDAAGTPFEDRARRIGGAAERSARIVQTFLAMARQRERQVALVDMNDVIASALELTEYGLRTAGIAVRVNFGSGLPPIEGDRDQLHQVLVNLIVNAQQAMEKGEAFEKVLTIRTSVNQAGRILVDVSDTGSGIPDEVRHRVFEPFFTTKKQRSGGGTGIGLSFSQGIVTAHGGTLTIESSRRGAHFRIDLPAAAGAPATVVPRREAVIPDLPPSKRRCLVVEDEPDVAATLRELIEREGYEVTLAANGTEAFYALDQSDFDLLFSDLRMPLLSGPEIYERLCETRPDLVKRMAFVTGDTMGDNMADFLRNCGRPILEKPFTRAGIRAVLAALVEPA